MNHEAAFVSAFVVPEKRARYLEFLANPKRRHEILNRLGHFDDFLTQFATETGYQQSGVLDGLLRARGAGRLAHVISMSEDLDGREMPLLEALEGVLDYPFGSVVSCLPGRLAFYIQHEAPTQGFILEKKP